MQSRVELKIAKASQGGSVPIIFYIHYKQTKGSLKRKISNYENNKKGKNKGKEDEECVIFL